MKAAELRMKLLTPAGLKQAEDRVTLTARDSDRRAEVEANAATFRARWEAEEPIREARAKIEKAGWCPIESWQVGKFRNRRTREVATLEQITGEAEE
jgi:hypothetical protein